jgi:hypothetical protein
MEGVYCEVRPKYLNIIHDNFRRVRVHMKDMYRRISDAYSHRRRKCVIETRRVVVSYLTLDAFLCLRIL